MKTLSRTVVAAGALAIGFFAAGASPARAQALGFGYASPGLSFGVATGGPGYYGVYPGPVVAPPVVVAPAPVLVPRPLVVPRPYYYGGYYGPRAYPRYYRHWR
jgi:hypothetical protein